MTERPEEERSLGLGLGPNINPNAAGANGEDDEGTEDPSLSSIRSHQIPFQTSKNDHIGRAKLSNYPVTQNKD